MEEELTQAILKYILVNDDADVEMIETAVQTWKCLEIITGMSNQGEVGLISPQQLMKVKANRPEGCCSVIEALLPFQQRKHGEQRFFDLVNAGILSLRPKV